MRIRKRHALVVEPPQPTRSAVSPVNNGNEDEHFGGQQDNCTCCSRLRRLQNGEPGNVFERESGEPSNRFANGTALGDKNQVPLPQARYVRAETPPSMADKFRGRSGCTSPDDCDNSEIIDAEEKESNAATTMDLFKGLERVRNTERNIKANNTQEYNNGQFHGSEGDENHPGNKPKESLLYSLYCVFSKLSGKSVLTAREALSRIMEERLPGLDEETGLPSVQVAKVIRSNPYFVHLEGGKFFLCSAPSSSEDPYSPEDFVDNEQPPRCMNPVFQSQMTPRNSSKAQGSKEKQQQNQQQPFSNIEAIGTKRPRSKEVGTVNVGGTVGKTQCRSSGPKREGQEKAVKVRNSIPEQGDYGADPVEHICKRYDGRGWKCHEIALPGYSMCRHHHELIVNRLARLRSTGRLGSKKSGKRRKNCSKPLKEGHSVIDEGEISVNNENNEAHWFKTVKARSLKSINN